ncbi:MAG: hypothetical protein LBI70_03440 [Rickettsiales bacterium]|jgi:hypothetical protein|nr:hypothetical protein [Rickettsiales bacterium]
MKKDILTKMFLENQIILQQGNDVCIGESDEDENNRYFEFVRDVDYSNVCLEHEYALKFLDYLRSIQFRIDYITLVDREKHEYAGSFDVRRRDDETTFQYTERSYPKYRSYIGTNVEPSYANNFLFHFSFEYDRHIKNRPILGVSGYIIYGKYVNYGIYVEKSEFDGGYEMTLWDRDDSSKQFTFNFKTENEIKSFFENNEMLVKWEEEKKVWREEAGSGGI